MLKFNAPIVGYTPSLGALKSETFEIEFYTDKYLQVSDSVLDDSEPRQIQIGLGDNVVRGKFCLAAFKSTPPLDEPDLSGRATNFNNSFLFAYRIVNREKFKNNAIFVSSGRCK